MTLHDKFVELRTALNAKHFERRDEIDITLLALLSGFHVALIGPPGTAKSLLARDICSVFDGGRYFEWLMTKFTAPEELYGPNSIPALKEGKYVRITTGKLPEADIAFLDEFWKSSSSIINTMLTIMNEGKFHNNSSATDVPLKSLFAASNEMPEGEELNALFDRFHFRKIVGYINEPGNFIEMLQLDQDTVELPHMTFDELIAAQQEVMNIEFSQDMAESIYGIRDDLVNTAGIVPSDRRLKQSMIALRANAWLEGRNAVDDPDFMILEHMLWSTPQEQKPVLRVILDHTNPLDREAVEIRDQVEEIAALMAAAVRESKQAGSDTTALSKNASEWWTKIRSLAPQLKKLKNRAVKQGRPVDRMDDIARTMKRVSTTIGAEFLGISLDLDDLE